MPFPTPSTDESAAPPAAPRQIFVSHISDEAELAGLLQQMLEADFAGQVRLFTSSDIRSIGTSEDWLAAIERALGQAVALIVLCSRSSVHKPWVQFEIGAAWMKQVPIVPACHSGLTPDRLDPPLARLEGLELGTARGLERLYVTVSRLLGLDPPRLPADPAGRLARIQPLEARFANVQVQQFERYIDIVVAPGEAGAERIADDAAVESDDASLALFGLMPGVPRRWRDIVRAAQKGSDTRWIGQLEAGIRLAGQNEWFRPVQAVYHAERGSFQPQLARKEVLADGRTRFHVHLVETVVAPLADVPGAIGTLATLLRLGLRFRYEVIERFRRLELAAPDATAALAPDALAPLVDAIEVIEVDARSRGAEDLDLDDVLTLFDTAAERDEIARLDADWNAARALLFRADPPPSAGETAGALRRLRAVNARFLRLGTARFADIVRTRWDAAA